jgi:tetratricopeptide (TPR) repeat protein
VLRVDEQSARVRMLGETHKVTFLSRDVWRLVPGHLVTLVITNEWLHRDSCCATGLLENPRIDIERLGLVPLRLIRRRPLNLRAGREPYESPDPYAALWQELTREPRPSFEMDGVAWGAFPGLSPDNNVTGCAATLAQAGKSEEARELLMGVLQDDLRCIDAHARLGCLAFGRWPERALLHFEIGLRIAELSLPDGFDGVLVWELVFNRPLHRCLLGQGLCLWRLGRLSEARQAFERILILDPSDDQGARFPWHDVNEGRSWESVHGRLARAQQRADRRLH